MRFVSISFDAFGAPVLLPYFDHTFSNQAELPLLYMANMAIQPVELNCELRLGKFRSYGDAQHEAKVVFVENYILIS